MVTQLLGAFLVSLIIIGYGSDLLAENTETPTVQTLPSDKNVTNVNPNQMNVANEKKVSEKDLPSANVNVSEKLPVILSDTKNELRITDIILLVFNGILSLFTGLLCLSTYKLWRSTEKLWEVAVEQGKDMKRSIREATRSAFAMENVAISMEASVHTSKEIVRLQKTVSAMQLRAYLMVTINQGIFQERDKGLRFEVKPLLINAGNTPARKVSYWAKADVWPLPLPDDFAIPTEKGSNPFRESILGPHQNVVISGLVDEFYEDAEVDNIKYGKGRATYIWGRVTYEDWFGESHETNFCHCIFWVRVKDGELITGLYANKHNDAN